jgi:hypothetical protein
MKHLALTAIVALLVVAAASLAPLDIQGELARRFWRDKASCEHCASVVVAGSSRFYRGVDPARLQSAFPHATVFNFGFSAQGWSPDYLDAVERALVTSGTRAILLDATAVAFTPWAQKAGHYARWAKLAKPTLANRITEPLHDIVDSAIPRRVPCELMPPVCDQRYPQRYDANGFVASDRRPPSETAFAPTFERVLRASPISLRIVDDVADRIRTWRAAGIDVFVVRPPVSNAIASIEAAHGYDESVVRERLESAGARWLDVDGVFATQDGSHLNADSAERYSENIAQLVTARRLR